MENCDNILSKNLNGLKLFNLFSDGMSLTFIKAIYNEYTNNNESINSLKFALDDYQRKSFLRQIEEKTSSLALIIFGFDEFTVIKINNDYPSIEDILCNAKGFISKRYLTKANQIKLLNELVAYYNRLDFFENFISELLYDYIQDNQPIHKNILLKRMSDLIHSLNRLMARKYLNIIINNGAIKKTVNGYEINERDNHNSDENQPNREFIFNSIGNFFKDFEKLISEVENSELNIPKKYYYLKRFILQLGFKIEKKFVLNPSFSTLDKAVDSWLKAMPGIIDKSNTDNIFNDNSYFKYLLETRVLVPYKKNTFINSSKFLNVNTLNMIWEDIYLVIPNKRILTTKKLIQDEGYIKIFDKYDIITYQTFNDYFLQGLIDKDVRINKILYNSHIFCKNKKIQKLDVINEIVVENRRISISRLKHRLERDYGLINFDYNLIKKGEIKFGFHKDSKNVIYKDYNTYVEFMRRGK